MFTILLWNERSERFEHRFSSRYGERITRERNVLLGEASSAPPPAASTVLAPDVRRDPRYIMVNPEVRSELSVPLIYKGKVIGVIDLEHTRVNYYNEDHQRTLGTLAAQVAISIANARLYQRIHEEEQRMERDLEMAREVQLRLLRLSHRSRPMRRSPPAFCPLAPSVEIFMTSSTTAPAAPHSPSAMSVARRHRQRCTRSGNGILRSLAARHYSPSKMLAVLNNQLQERKLDSQYVTMLLAVWDDDQRTLQIANAGSVQPFFVTTSTQSLTNAIDVKSIKAEGFPLGLFPNAEYEEFTIPTKPGDLIIFFSDGIVDAETPKGRCLGQSGCPRCWSATPLQGNPRRAWWMPSSTPLPSSRPARSTSMMRRWLSSACSEV